jgi:hypothetical protein
MRPSFPTAERCRAAREAIAHAEEGLALPADPATTQELKRIIREAQDQMARIPCGSS